MKLLNQRHNLAHKHGKNKLKLHKIKLSSKTISGTPGNI